MCSEPGFGASVSGSRTTSGAGSPSRPRLWAARRWPRLRPCDEDQAAVRRLFSLLHHYCGEFAPDTIPSDPPSWSRSQLSSVAVSDRLGQLPLPVGECVCFLTGFFDFLGIGGSLSPSGDGLLADLFLGRPRSRRYPKFNIRRDIPDELP